MSSLIKELSFTILTESTLLLYQNGVEEVIFSIKAIKNLYNEEKYQELIKIVNDLENSGGFFDLTIDEQIEYYYYLIRSLTILGEYIEALQRVTKARTNLRTPMENSLLLALMVAQLRLLIMLGQFDEAWGVCEEGDAIIANLSLEKNITAVTWCSKFLNTKGGFLYYYKGEFDRALDCLNQALTLNKLIKDQKENAIILYNMGNLNLLKGDLNTALKYFKRALSFAEESGNKYTLNRTLAGIGTIYFWKGEFDKAQKYYQQTLTLSTELGNQQEIASSLLNLGNVYGLKGLLNEALKYQKKSLEFHEKSANKKDISRIMNNIGYTYHQKGELDKALDYYHKSLAIKEEIGEKLDILTTVQNIGNVYHHKELLNEALSYYQRGFILAQEINHDLQASTTLFDLIRLALDLEDQAQAQIYLNKLKELKERTAERIIHIRYQFADALVLRAKKMLSEAQILLNQVIQPEPIDYGMTLLARVTICQILFEEYVNSGRKAILDDLDNHLVFSIALAKQKHFNGIILAISILQGKLASLQSNFNVAQLIFQNVKDDADNRGFETLKKQSEEELVNLQEYIALDKVLKKQETQHSQFRMEQTKAIRNYLEIIIRQTQSEL